MYGKQLRELRKSKNLTLRDASNQLGISFTSLGNYEREDREPNINTLIRLADFYNVSLDYLLKGAGNMNNIFKAVQEYADKHYDGHFTLMKFTTNWRAIFGTIDDREDVSAAREGKTAEEALQNLMNDPISVYDLVDREELFRKMAEYERVMSMKNNKQS